LQRPLVLEEDIPAENLDEVKDDDELGRPDGSSNEPDQPNEPFVPTIEDLI